MNVKEFIVDYSHFDKILVKLCRLISKGRSINPKLYGLVGAAIIDPDQNIIARTARFRNKKWSHAEREAILAYNNAFGEIPKNSILISTLSPCEEIHTDPAPDRYGKSCTALINDTNIKFVYCGYLDPSQGDDQHDARTFKLIASKNPDVAKLCKKYADKFLIKHTF